MQLPDPDRPVEDGKNKWLWCKAIRMTGLWPATVYLSDRVKAEVTNIQAYPNGAYERNGGLTCRQIKDLVIHAIDQGQGVHTNGTIKVDTNTLIKNMHFFIRRLQDIDKLRASAARHLIIARTVGNNRHKNIIIALSAMQQLGAVEVQQYWRFLKRHCL